MHWRSSLAWCCSSSSRRRPRTCTAHTQCTSHALQPSVEIRSEWQNLQPDGRDMWFFFAWFFHSLPSLSETTGHLQRRRAYKPMQRIPKEKLLYGFPLRSCSVMSKDIFSGKPMEEILPVAGSWRARKVSPFGRSPPS